MGNTQNSACHVASTLWAAIVDAVKEEDIRAIMLRIKGIEAWHTVDPQHNRAALLVIKVQVSLD
jgi:hypothetical protein